MSRMSELHYQIANTSPREVWEGFSETEDGFEPLSDDELDLMAVDALAAWNQALDERAFDQAEAARLGRSSVAGFHHTILVPRLQRRDSNP